VVYTDGQFDDARLAVALARTADDLSATVVNRVAVEGLAKSTGGRISGVVAKDVETGERFEVSARVVVNATGVFTDAIRRLDEPVVAPLVTVSQGVHVVLERGFLPGDTAVLIPKTDDGRVLFLIPWHDRVLVGTTDTPVASPEPEPRPLAEEIDFLLSHAGRYLNAAPGLSDVRSTFAGLRPLIRPRRSSGVTTSRLSREHTVEVSRSGLVTITGGKWTTYRRMAETAVDLAAEVGGLAKSPCPTANLPLHGCLDEVAAGPFAVYGADAAALERLQAEDPQLAEPIHPGLPYRLAEVVWAARHESARTVEDVLARRTRALFLDARAALDAAPRVASLLATELSHGPEWRDQQIVAFRALARGYLVPGDGA
jgi:glycerol-3-phosphate dehydrogenase